jgi:drug/metabolite transporter (DMT)-like permease
MELITIAVTVSWVFFGARILASGAITSCSALPRNLIIRCLLLGLLNPTCYYWILLQAYDLLPAHDAMAINYTWGLTLPLIASLFSRTLPSKGEAGLALLSYVGILIIVTDANLSVLQFDAPKGVALALFSTVLWGLSWVINSRTVDEHSIDPELTLFLNFTAAVPMLWLVTNANGGLTNIGLEGILGGLYIGLCEMGLAFVLWMNALRLTSNPIRISSLIFLAPPLSLVLIGTVLGEVIAGSTLLGLGVILCGLAGQQVLGRTR